MNNFSTIPFCFEHGVEFSRKGLYCPPTLVMEKRESIEHWKRLGFGKRSYLYLNVKELGQKPNEKFYWKPLT